MTPEEAQESECYTCESCKQHYKRGIEDAEALEEYKKNFEEGKKHITPELSEDLYAVVIICDDCYQAMKEKAPWLV